MGFSLAILMWAIPAILVVAVIATLFARFRSRHGLQPGFRVIPQLRWVDAVSLGIHAATQLFAMVGWLMLPWRAWFSAQVASVLVLVCAFSVGMFLFMGLTTFLTTSVLRLLLRSAGVFTAEQARHYPLRANKWRMDPWPASWQEAIPQL